MTLPQDSKLMRLTCLGWSDESAAARRPTLAEIQAALGAHARIERENADPEVER